MEFKHLLVPFDDSPSSKIALKKAILTAKIFDAEITVCFVRKDNADSEIEKTKKIKEYIESFMSTQRVKYNFVERKGRIYREITQLEKELSVDLVMMGTHGIKGFQEFWIGSNSFRVVSASNCPVITMQEIAYPEAFQKILLPLADSDETRQKVPLVAKLAAGFDAEIVIFCVSRDTDEEVKRKLHAYAAQTQRYLDQVGVKHSLDESYGKNIAQECIDYSKKNGVDLISIMTETESSGSLFLGTYAQQLVNHSPIPVISIHNRSIGVTAGLT
jgi:nucleotide-binding universal stress UspA family protein